MGPLTLSLRAPPRQRVDVSALTPDRLAGKGADDVAAIGLMVGNRRVRVGDLFEITGAPLAPDEAEEVVIAESCDRLDRIGQGMTRGLLTISGDAGAYAGAGMVGGALVIDGNAGPFAASGMTGGEVRIGGDAGDFLGAAVPGDRIGMNGGVVHVAGNIGERAGDRMRRGVVLVEGAAGAYCGARMIAGSIVVLGPVGDFMGLAMRRGTLLLFQPPGRVLATFNDCGLHNIPFLRLFLGYVTQFGGAFANLDKTRDRVRRYAGDQGVGGRGEILVYER